MNIEQFLPFLHNISAPLKEKLERSATQKVFEKGQVFSTAASDCLGLMLINSGQLRAYISSGSKELTLYRLTDGDVCLFSAGCILKNISYDIFVDCEKQCQCIIIPTNIAQDLMQDISAQTFINDIMSKRFFDVLWLVENALFSSFDKRLAAFLVEQSALDNSYTITVTHQEIANHLGSAREVVTRMLKHFQQESLVDISRGEIKILQINKLIELANKDN